MSDTIELWVSGEVKGGLTTLVPSTVVSAKATDTLRSDTPGKDLRRALRRDCGESDQSSSSREGIIMRFIVTFI